jgi:hypothetical protein
MEHPFVNQDALKELSLEELQEKMATLTQRLTFAYRTGNGPLIHQAQMILETYKKHYRDKMDKLFEKQGIQNKINVDTKK